MSTRNSIVCSFVVAAAFLLGSSGADSAPPTKESAADKSLGCGISTLTISGNTATATISLVGLVGTEFILEFDQVQNLTHSNLGLCARLIGPLQLVPLLARLPDEGLVGALQLAIPLLISVEPPQSGSLSFNNAYRAEIHTHLLGFTLDSPFRLYKAPQNGMFYDVTNEVAEGSVRTRGRTGGFSDFIVLIDLISDADHATDKYEYLAARIENSAIHIKVRNDLRNDLVASRAAFDSADYPTALARIDTFSARVRKHAGTAIPNQWRAQRDRDNIAGDLIGYAESLRFSLQRSAD